MTSTTALLPCPFCGHSDIAIKNETPDDNSGGYFIECPGCNASTSLRYACGDDPTPLLAEQWNRRNQVPCLHQIAEPGAYPELPKGTRERQLSGSADVYTAYEMRAYVDADRAMRVAGAPVVDMTPPATSRDRWMYEQGRLAERDARTPGSTASQMPHNIEQMAVDRYKVVPSHSSMFYPCAVVAGDGKQQLYIGREVECQNMARKFAGAFLDGAFVALAAAPAAGAPAAQEGQARVPVAALWVEANGAIDFEVIPPCTLPVGEYDLYAKPKDAAQAAQGGA